MPHDGATLILTIDDEKSIRESFRNFLEDFDYQVLTAENGRTGLEVFKQKKPDLVLVDLRMPEVDGLEVLSNVTRMAPDIPVIVVSGTGVIGDVVEALRLGAWDYLLKPVEDLDVLRHAVEKALERTRLIKLNKAYQEHLEKEVSVRTRDLRISEEKYRTLTSELPVGLYRVSENGDILYANPALARILDYENADDLFSVTINELFVDEGDLINKIAQWKATRGVASNEFRLKTKNGKHLWVKDTGKIVFDDRDDISYIEGIIENITEQKHAKETLRESQERMKLALEGADLGMWDWDIGNDRYILDARAVEILGGYPVNNKDWDNLLHPDDVEKTDAAINVMLEGSTSYLETEFRVIRTDGSIRWAKDRGKVVKRNREGKPLRASGTLQDITETKLAAAEKQRLEIKLQQAQKMESIGTLAGGIAHDFNNILFPIMGYSEMLIDDVPKGSMMRQNLEGILKAANRAKDLIKQILTFCSETSEGLKPLLMQPIINEAMKLLRSSIPTSIAFNINIDRNCGTIMGDPTQIHQIIMNLCTNAFHAMQDTGGELSVSLNEVQLNSGDLNGKNDIVPGCFLKLEVSDTGIGMDPDILERIFDPYFTTKAPGKGTGMGLSVIHGIVKTHGGTIAVTSTPGIGTTFKIYLPLIETLETGERLIPEEIALMGNERILLVDDEEQIIHMGKQMLERLGYTVSALSNSIEAYEAFCSNPERYDLVITDMTMPNFSGDELARKLLDVRPDIPIILATGFSEQVNEEKAEEVGAKAFILKPIIKNELARVIRKVLGKP